MHCKEINGHPLTKTFSRTVGVRRKQDGLLVSHPAVSSCTTTVGSIHAR